MLEGRKSRDGRWQIDRGETDRRWEVDKCMKARGLMGRQICGWIVYV